MDFSKAIKEAEELLSTLKEQKRILDEKEYSAYVGDKISSLAQNESNVVIQLFDSQELKDASLSVEEPVGYDRHVKFFVGKIHKAYSDEDFFYKIFMEGIIVYGNIFYYHTAYSVYFNRVETINGYNGLVLDKDMIFHLVENPNEYYDFANLVYHYRERTNLLDTFELPDYGKF